MLLSELWPTRNQRLWGSILTVCLSVWTQGAAAEVIHAIVGQTVTLPAPDTVDILLSVWYRGTGAADPQQICTYFVSPPSQVNGPQFTGRETCGPDGSLLIRDLLSIYTGNYTVNVIPRGALPATATRQLRVYEKVPSLMDSPGPTPGSCWQTTLGVACGVFLVAAIIVAGMAVHYERRLKQKDTHKDDNVYQNPSVIKNSDTQCENMRKGREGQSANPDLAANPVYMELEHGDRATYDQLKR